MKYIHIHAVHMCIYKLWRHYYVCTYSTLSIYITPVFCTDCNKDPIYENPNDMVGQPGPETQIPLTVNPGYESIVLSCGRHLYENRGQAHGDVQAMQNEDN